MSDDEYLSEASSSPSSLLSTALDTAVLEASSRATDGNTASFTSNTSDTSQYVKQGGKVYLAVDHTANLKKGSHPSWIWDHGDELRLLAGERPQRNWRCNHYHPPNQAIIPVESTTFYAGEHLRKKHKKYKPRTEPVLRKSISQ
jgi:hypothetical protein